MFQKLATIALLLCASAGFAEVVTIESFENDGDPANWQVNVTAGHTLNATVTGPVPEFVTTDVTEGILAGKFLATWNQTTSPTAENVYDVDGPSVYWAVRYNVNAPASLPNNSIATADGLLQADITNLSSAPVWVALAVDSVVSSQLERGPLHLIDAGSSATYVWDFATTPPVGFDTGDGVFSGDVQRLKSLLVYTPVQPTDSTLALTVDNIRNGNSPPIPTVDPPKILSLTQGVSPGEAVLTWAAESDPNVAAYSIFVATDVNFGTPEINRLTFPQNPVTTVPAAQRSVVLSGLPTDRSVYVKVGDSSSFKDEGEDVFNPVFTAFLNADGAPPQDRIVIDHNLLAYDDLNFVKYGYAHAAVYTAQALAGLDRTFDSVSAEAVDTGVASLTPAPDGIVIWSNLKDGEIAGTSLSSPSRLAISNFLANDGKLIISGSALAQDLGASPGVLEALFQASLQTGNIGVSVIKPIAPLTTAPLSTGLNPATNAVAYFSSDNDGILPAGGSASLATYNNIPAVNSVAAVGKENSFVFLGFAFETVGNSSGPSASALARENLMNDMVNYLNGIGETDAKDWQLFN